jgi:hypothetical protein
MRKLMAALVLAGLAVACTDQATAPEQQQTPAIAADFMNNPDGGGAVVDRFAWGYWNVAWNNLPANTVRVYHTTFPLSWAGIPWDDAVCGPQNVGPAMHFQEVAHWDHLNPDDVWIQNGMGDVWIAIVDRTASGPCNTRPLIASGWGRIHYTDNNVTGLGRDQNAWTFRAEGLLTMAATGEQVRYRGLWHCVVNKNHLYDPFESCNYTIDF